MTKKEFLKRAEAGKTLFCLQHVEGEPEQSFTCCGGRIEEILPRLSEKVAFCFLQMRRSCKTGPFPAGQALGRFCDAVKEDYAVLEAAWLRGEIKE